MGLGNIMETVRMLDIVSLAELMAVQGAILSGEEVGAMAVSLV